MWVLNFISLQLSLHIPKMLVSLSGKEHRQMSSLSNKTSQLSSQKDIWQLRKTEILLIIKYQKYFMWFVPLNKSSLTWSSPSGRSYARLEFHGSHQPVKASLRQICTAMHHSSFELWTLNNKIMEKIARISRTKPRPQATPSFFSKCAPRYAREKAAGSGRAWYQKSRAIRQGAIVSCPDPPPSAREKG